MSDLYTLIPWVLERIVNDEYSVGRDSEGHIKQVELDPHSAYTAAAFKGTESVVLAGMPEENRAAFLCLKEGYTQESLTHAMTKLWGPFAGPWMAERLAGATWKELVTWLAGMFKAAWEGEGKWEGIGPRLARTREGFGTSSDGHMEQKLQSTQPGTLRMILEKKYARDLIRLFPKLVDRAVGLPSLLVAHVEPSGPVKRYLNEANRCYIYGQFLGALLVCRASIETSIKHRLQGMEPSAEVENMQLQKLIDMAHDKGLLDPPLRAWSHDVRTIANVAAHPERSVSEDDCKRSFQKTREILRYLYKDPGNH